MIGVFDSGVGGLTVVKEILKTLPNKKIIYFGDTARLPYGTKGADFVKNQSKKITEWLLKKGAKIVVIACNTSSAWAAEYLKKEFPEVPIFEMITPATSAAKSIGAEKIGVMGTPGTIRSRIYEKKLKSKNVFLQACPLFVPLVEEGIVSGKLANNIARFYCATLKGARVSSLILGCTHYPLLQKTISKIMGKKVKIINPAETLANDLKIFLKNNKMKLRKGRSHKFYFSDKPYNLDKISRLCLKQGITPIIKDPFA